MKYLRIIDTPGVLREAGVHGANYTEAKEYILRQYYGEAGSFEFGLELFADFITETIIYDILENFIPNSNLFSLNALMKYDVILVNSNPFFFKNQKVLRQLRKHRTVIVWDGIFIDLSNYKESFDAVLTCSHSIVARYEKLGTRAYYLPFSYDYRLDDLLNVDQRKPIYSKCAFIGGINVGKRAHYQRIRDLSSAKEDLDFYIKEGQNSRLKNLFLLTKSISLAADYKQLSRRNLGPVFGLDYHNKILDYRGIVNTHLDDISTPSNIRIFEVTGLGRVLITDRQKGLNLMFKENEEILAYSSPKELQNHIKLVKNDPEYAKYLGTNARAKTKEKYGIKNRVDAFNIILNDINS